MSRREVSIETGREVADAAVRAVSGGARVRPPAQARSRQSLDRMLEAAEMLIARHGVATLTIADVVRQAKSSNGAFYARFADKDALVREVQDRFLRRVEAQTLTALATVEASTVDAETAARAMTRLISLVFREHGALIGAFVRGSGRDDVLLRRAAGAQRRLADGVIALLKGRCNRSETAAEIAFRFVVATFEQYVSVDEATRWADWATVADELEDAVVAYLTR
jgi:AcrR family transcriptional regulator